MAGQYAQECYDKSIPVDSPGCSTFYQQRIDYSTRRQQACPFAQEMCAKGLFSAIEFDTGNIGLEAIGINTATKHKFRRRTSCSPLNMTEDFVKSVRNNRSDDVTFNYYYGATEDSAYPGLFS